MTIDPYIIDYHLCILKLYTEATEDDFELIDHGEGCEISYWNTSKLGTQPSLITLATSWIDVVRDDKVLELKNSLVEEFDAGDHGYTTQGFDPNFKMNSSRQDLYNIDTLHRDLVTSYTRAYLQYYPNATVNEINIYVDSQSIPGSGIRDYDNNFHAMTIGELGTLLLEMQNYGLWLYQNKWTKEAAVLAAVTIEDIVAISFWS